MLQIKFKVITFQLYHSSVWSDSSSLGAASSLLSSLAFSSVFAVGSGFFSVESSGLVESPSLTECNTILTMSMRISDLVTCGTDQAKDYEDQQSSFCYLMNSNRRWMRMRMNMVSRKLGLGWSGLGAITRFSEDELSPCSPSPVLTTAQMRSGTSSISSSET